LKEYNSGWQIGWPQYGAQFFLWPFDPARELLAAGWRRVAGAAWACACRGGGAACWACVCRAGAACCTGAFIADAVFTGGVFLTAADTVFAGDGVFLTPADTLFAGGGVFLTPAAGDDFISTFRSADGTFTVVGLLSCTTFFSTGNPCLRLAALLAIAVVDAGSFKVRGAPAGPAPAGRPLDRTASALRRA
jgi:hypothetical protein